MSYILKIYPEIAADTAGQALKSAALNLNSQTVAFIIDKRKDITLLEFGKALISATKSDDNLTTSQILLQENYKTNLPYA